MGNLKWLYPCVGAIVVLFATIGGIGIPRLIEELEYTKNGIIQTEFERLQQETIFSIQTNLTSLASNLNTAIVGLNQLETNVLDLPYSSLDQFQNLTATPIDNSGFDILRVLYFRKVETLSDRVDHEELGKKLYGIPSFPSFDLMAGAPTSTPPDELPLILLLVATPRGITPSLPAIGSLNGVSLLSSKERDHILNLQNGEFAVSEIRRVQRVDETVNVAITLDYYHQGWYGSVAFNPAEFLNTTIGNFNTNEMLG